MDNGHHLGTIAAAAYAFDYPLVRVFDFDQAQLNQAMGWANQAWVRSAAIADHMIPDHAANFDCRCSSLVAPITSSPVRLWSRAIRPLWHWPVPINRFAIHNGTTIAQHFRRDLSAAIGPLLSQGGDFAEGISGDRVSNDPTYAIATQSREAIAPLSITSKGCSKHSTAIAHSH
ncbi:MAG: hypothetical protein F6K00_05100 [Leptolyngbya sp. SIOISBB]|nr:hypothetical protein [Leptolyngbya sp. SIOISBB]